MRGGSKNGKEWDEEENVKKWIRAKRAKLEEGQRVIAADQLHDVVELRQDSELPLSSQSSQEEEAKEARRQRADAA